MDIKSHEVIERRRDGNNNDESNNNDNSYNGNNPSVSCTIQTLDHHHHRPKSPSTLCLSGSNVTAKTVRYRECLKNHAASVGGSVHDGCGEFMPGGEEGSIEALKCAACDCHRNFHRKVVDGSGGHSSTAVRPPPAGVMSMMMNPVMLPPPPNYHHHHHDKYGLATPMSVAYGGGGESSSEDLNLYGQSSGEYGAFAGTQTLPQTPFSMAKKRYRTKFTSEQKERMMEFAEKLGWRMNKQDEEELEKFCAEVGVKRQVFKVWMHNNKNNVKKQLSI